MAPAFQAQARGFLRALIAFAPIGHDDRSAVWGWTARRDAQCAKIRRLLATYWSDAAAINDSYGRLLHEFRDLARRGGRLLQRMALFSIYLEGKVSSLDAAIWLERLAFYGAISQGLGIVTRPLISVTLHFPAGQQQRIVSIFFQPEDLAIMLLLMGLLALAHIQKAAAEIAGEHAQFV
jgi:hypothetical protein